MSKHEMKSDIFFMKQALKQAEKSFLLNEVPVGCVIVLNQKIIARSHNVVEKKNTVTAHAEIICIQKASRYLKNWRLLNTTLYSTLEPCAMCMGSILLSRIQRLVYGAADLRMGASGSWVNLIDGTYSLHSLEVSSGVLQSESEKIMKDFFKKRRIDNNERQKK